jgi:quercetin dioxygenase-like cupin family protein
MKTILPGDHPTLETVPGRFGEIIIVGENAMMMRLTVQPNVPTPPHSHPHEQMGTLISGAGTLSTREKEVKATVGAAWFLEPHEEHKFETTGGEPAVIIETFAPARVDYVIQAK